MPPTELSFLRRVTPLDPFLNPERWSNTQCMVLLPQSSQSEGILNRETEKPTEDLPGQHGYSDSELLFSANTGSYISSRDAGGKDTLFSQQLYDDGCFHEFLGGMSCRYMRCFHEGRDNTLKNQIAQPATVDDYESWMQGEQLETSHRKFVDIHPVRRTSLSFRFGPKVKANDESLCSSKLHPMTNGYEIHDSNSFKRGEAHPMTNDSNSFKRGEAHPMTNDSNSFKRGEAHPMTNDSNSFKRGEAHPMTNDSNSFKRGEAAFREPTTSNAGSTWQLPEKSFKSRLQLGQSPRVTMAVAAPTVTMAAPTVTMTAPTMTMAAPAMTALDLGQNQTHKVNKEEIGVESIHHQGSEFVDIYYESQIRSRKSPLLPLKRGFRKAKHLRDEEWNQGTPTENPFTELEDPYPPLTDCVMDYFCSEKRKASVQEGGFGNVEIVGCHMFLSEPFATRSQRTRSQRHPPVITKHSEHRRRDHKKLPPIPITTAGFQAQREQKRTNPKHIYRGILHQGMELSSRAMNISVADLKSRYRYLCSRNNYELARISRQKRQCCSMKTNQNDMIDGREFDMYSDDISSYASSQERTMNKASSAEKTKMANAGYGESDFEKFSKRTIHEWAKQNCHGEPVDAGQEYGSSILKLFGTIGNEILMRMDKIEAALRHTSEQDQISIQRQQHINYTCDLPERSKYGLGPLSQHDHHGQSLHSKESKHDPSTYYLHECHCESLDGDRVLLWRRNYWEPIDCTRIFNAAQEDRPKVQEQPVKKKEQHHKAQKQQHAEPQSSSFFGFNLFGSSSKPPEKKQSKQAKQEKQAKEAKEAKPAKEAKQAKQTKQGKQTCTDIDRCNLQKCIQKLYKYKANLTPASSLVCKHEWHSTKRPNVRAVKSKRSGILKKKSVSSKSSKKGKAKKVASRGGLGEDETTTRIELLHESLNDWESNHEFHEKPLHRISMLREFSSDDISREDLHRAEQQPKRSYGRGSLLEFLLLGKNRLPFRRLHAPSKTAMETRLRNFTEDENAAGLEPELSVIASSSDDEETYVPSQFLSHRDWVPEVTVFGTDIRLPLSHERYYQTCLKPIRKRRHSPNVSIPRQHAGLHGIDVSLPGEHSHKSDPADDSESDSRDEAPVTYLEKRREKANPDLHDLKAELFRLMTKHLVNNKKKIQGCSLPFSRSPRTIPNNLDEIAPDRVQFPVDIERKCNFIDSKPCTSPNDDPRSLTDDMYATRKEAMKRMQLGEAQTLQERKGALGLNSENGTCWESHHQRAGNIEQSTTTGDDTPFWKDKRNTPDHQQIFEERLQSDASTQLSRTFIETSTHDSRMDQVHNHQTKNSTSKSLKNDLVFNVYHKKAADASGTWWLGLPSRFKSEIRSMSCPSLSKQQGDPLDVIKDASEAFYHNVYVQGIEIQAEVISTSMDLSDGNYRQRDLTETGYVSQCSIQLVKVTSPVRKVLQDQDSIMEMASFKGIHIADKDFHNYLSSLFRSSNHERSSHS
ncbi:unnamed protein product [Cyprideis torosa]|uniref:Uncharacterized protein n=1 Tax=Cyprideis torosa TaxID=163714 RepID=A0A7R8ZQK7_9CRUS|nr:unnamed protein product [Cyprideis torosa]CAG0892237.1 unnamed protein product [Cyprideis torosa]